MKQRFNRIISMELTIITPEKIVYNGDVSLVNVPGTKGPFQILKGHAPIISSLKSGVVSYIPANSNDTDKICINNGFVEVSDDKINICAELSKN